MGLRDQAEAAAGRPVADRPMRRGALAPAERRQDLMGRVKSLEEEFARAMPANDARQLVQDAVTCIRQVPKLDEVDPGSLLGSLMTIAQLGLRPGVNGLAWPLPFWDGKAKMRRAQTVIGYKGYVHLAYESRKLRKIIGRSVHEGDLFEVEYGTDDRLVHRPLREMIDPDTGKPRPITDFYVTWLTIDGGASFFWMTLQEIIQWRDRYAPRDSNSRIVGPWGAPVESSEFRAMALKTCLRRAEPWLPKSAALATAAQVDGSVRTNLDILADAGSVSEHPDPEPTGDGPVVEGTVIDPEREKDRAVAESMRPPAGEHDNLPPEDQDPTLQPGWGER